jgi:hypothetical protein
MTDDAGRCLAVGVRMRGWRRAWVLVLIAAGCRTPAPVAPRAVAPSVIPVSTSLASTQPTIPVLDGKELPRPTARQPGAPEGKAFSRLTERECLLLAAAHSGPANALDEENRVPPPPDDCKGQRDQLRQSVRYHAALELRNSAAAEALDRFHQFADALARADFVRKALPIVDDLHERARRAKAAAVRFPLDAGDLELQRSQLAAQLDQLELGSRLLNLDLKRRVGLPHDPADGWLWPEGDFAIDLTPVDPAEAAQAAVADRPELRGLRAFHNGLTIDTLPDVRDYLRAGNSLLGLPRTPLPLRRLDRILNRQPKPDPTLVAELEVRRKQLADLIQTREREVSDEARAAALAMNAQVERAKLARDRLRVWEEKLAEAVKKREANQPGAELQEAQVRLDWLKARGEVAAEVAAWHRARVKYRAALGWLAWEAIPK